MTSIEAFQKMSKDQMDAATAATSAFARGFQQIAAEATDFSKRTFENNSATFEKLIAARTPDAALQIQSEYARNAYEGFVAQATKMGELYTNIAKEAFKPLEGNIARFQESVSRQA